MEKIRNFYSRIPGYLKNRYTIAGFIFLVWMTFFDKNDFISQVKLRMELNTLKNTRDYYTEKIEEVKKDKKELLTNEETLEKFAREKYWMKRDNEDIFIIREEK